MSRDEARWATCRVSQFGQSGEDQVRLHASTQEISTRLCLVNTNVVVGMAAAKQSSRPGNPPPPVPWPPSLLDRQTRRCAVAKVVGRQAVTASSKQGSDCHGGFPSRLPTATPKTALFLIYVALKRTRQSPPLSKNGNDGDIINGKEKKKKRQKKHLPKLAGGCLPVESEKSKLWE
ncbi:uncharacterized protein LY79DRAFT_111014 [Colletotrichum navitas]|uniref:Uncharacterized protein n=1 Tax=Colletotrichum navitas TaxID=681940 RepID=A0AAD8Q3L8_9PEZI|nr:uncharacterized protein LY79DRAFT_111014 [Colletotrichum navitas]KAK1595327.1 hypothetical protein LY79DRAFT_111014 [Colletotrichum navitas]